MAAFSITTAQPSARLDLTRKGKLEFTVTNTAHRDLTARAHVVCEGTTQAGWFTVAEAQRESPPDATHQFGVDVAVPIKVPAGTYRFRLDVVGVEDPDEYEGEGVWATIDVPPAPEPRRIPLWIIILAAAGVIALAVVIYLVFIRQPPRPSLDVSATTTTFGTVPVGQGSPGAVVTVKNGGAADAKVTAALSGLNPSDFKVLASTCATAPVLAGQSCQIQVGFQPSAQGSRAATLTVSAPGADDVQLGLSGTGQGTAAAVVLTPPSVALNVQGTAQPAMVVTVKNNGQTPLTISGTRLDDANGAFQSVSSCEKVTLSQGQTCQVAVVFVYTKIGGNPVTARLLISDDAPGAPQVVPLSGVRVAASPAPR